MMTETPAANQPPPANASANGKTSGQRSGLQFGGSLSWVNINIQYFQSLPGILKILQLIIGILCMALASPARLSSTHWFLFVVVTSFILTLLLSIIYLLSIREALKININWLLIEFTYTAVYTALLVTAFITQLAAWSQVLSPVSWKNYNIAAGVFGLFDAVAYGAGTFLLFLEWKNSQTPRSNQQAPPQ